MALLNYKKDPLYDCLSNLIKNNQNEEFLKLHDNNEIFPYYDLLFKIALENKNFSALKTMIDKEKIRLKDDKKDKRKNKLINRLNAYLEEKCRFGKLEDLKEFMLTPILENYIDMYHKGQNYTDFLDAAFVVVYSENFHIIDFLLNCNELKKKI